MMSASKLKAVSSGRLTGTTRRGKKDVMVQRFTRPITVPAYSLYSTDSEDQVSTIHRGLDHCASLLDRLLQADSAESKPSQNGVVDTRGQRSLGRRHNLERRKTGRTKTAPPAVPSPAVTPPSDAPGAAPDAPRSVGPAEGANQLSGQPTNRTTARFNARLPTSTPSRSPTGVPNGDPQSVAPSLGRLAPPGGPSACLTAGANGGTLASSPPLPGALAPSHPLPLPGALAPSHPLPLPQALALSHPLPGALAPSHPLPLPGALAPSHPLPLLGALTPSHPLPGALTPSHPLPLPGALAPSHPLPGALTLSHPLPLPGALAPSHPLPGALALSHPLPQPGPPSHPLTRAPCPRPLPSVAAYQQPPQTPPGPAPSASPLALPLSLVAPSPHPRPTSPVGRPVAPPPSDQPGRPLPLQNPPPTSGPIGGGGRAVTGRATEDEGEREECTAGAWTAKECTVERLQHTLEELWTVLAGKGYTAAERLLTEFERALADGPLGPQTSLAPQALRSQNAQPHRGMRIFNQQLQERERAERLCRESHCDAMCLEAELSAVQSQLGRLQAEVSELRMALHEKDAENARIRAGSVARCPGTSGQVLLLAQTRLKEMASRPGLCSVLQGPPLTRRALDQHQRGHDHSGPSSNQVHQYLSSLGAGQSGAGILEPCPDVWEDDRCISLSVMRGASESVVGGASEYVGGGASESVMGGASESVGGGASESVMGGASESVMRGASESVVGGASESVMRGASESVVGGASESVVGGASESVVVGASESVVGGPSQSVVGGASQSVVGGASESVGGGASESVVGRASVSVGGGASVSVGGGASEFFGGGASESIRGGASESMRGGAWLDPERVTFAPPEEVATSSLGGGGQSYQKVLRLLRSSNALAPLPGLGQSHGSPHWEVASHWSVGSGSTFDTRDEVAFCHGMAVLDASIASLQRSLRKDLVT
ncbi:uncharacterized protein LOC132460642 [Gadus macrocephalus]|uniref:uncharacterized protein LOC132460642 n=1 Tax=Gadus macrocephalus TaxID=80720 RepID=UPI0028CBA791|nr:uncharacterized protein LOC132460642 [Gadus macrocephalus]